jgi:RNA polymerase sigma factor for flagellar operon FliA
MDSRCPDRETLERLYVAEGIGMAKLGLRFGVCAMTISNWLRKRGISRRQQGSHVGSNVIPKGELVDFWNERYSLLQIAAHFRTTIQTIYRRAQEYDLGQKPRMPTVRVPAAGKAGHKALCDSLLAAYLADRSVANRNAIIEQNLRLVANVTESIHKRLPREIQWDDLFQWGVLGLMEAVKMFDPSRHTKFTTFATYRVRGQIIDGLRDTATRRRLAIARIVKLNKVEEQIRNEASREPTPEECIERLGITPAKYAERYKHRRPYNESLSSPLCVHEYSRAMDTSDTLLADSPDPAEVATAKATAAAIIDFVLENHRLTDALILRMHYLDSMTLKQIGQVIERTESCVSQHLGKIMASLRGRFSAAA